jgi:uncharacterized protein involved in response to NO
MRNESFNRMSAPPPSPPGARGTGAPAIGGIPVAIVNQRPAHAPPLPGVPLLRLGFRPFYLGAAAFGAVGMLLWFFIFTGRLALNTGLAPQLWHAHEMLFGFVAAVVIGFLLTAGQAWTQLPTPRGAALGGLALLWLLARVAAVGAPYPVFAALDVALLPLVAGVFISLLVRSRNKRNAAVGAVLALLALANIAFHLAASGLLAIDPLRPLHAGIALIVVLESIIGGRVVPSFTMNATPGLVLQERRRRDLCAIVLSAAGLALWACGQTGAVSALLLGAAALLQTWRVLSWKPWVTFDRPILWVLHLAYAWIPLGLGLLAAAQAGWLPATPAVHALTVGSMGGLIIGMVTRTARGHTGRPLKASMPEVASYALVLGAAAVRVAAPLLWPAATGTALVVAGSMWASAFILYAVQFAPWLLATRLDGRDG